MDDTPNRNTNHDDKLWHLAKKRVAFRWTLISYACTNLILIAIWFLSGRGMFWPIWVIIFWGIALIMQYFRLFHFGSVEEEYHKLKSKMDSEKNNSKL